MPQPPPSVSPHVKTTAPFPQPPKLQNRLREVSRDQDMSKNGSTSASRSGMREPLGSINTNSPKTKHTRIPAKPRSIPLPPREPDVFAPLKDSIASIDSQSSRLKRPREAPSPIPLKRSRVKDEKILLEGNVNLHKAEEEKWAHKWMKVFPTLTFHFEVGVDDGPGKALKSRVLKMGAKVDQFFSHHVTHLVVRGGSTPTKPKPIPRRGDLIIRESPKNPFLDGTGVTDLVEKAEAMQIKVWTVKKLGDMLSRLAPLHTSNNTLSHLLEDEKLHGTRERDLSAPRPDYYYFKPGSKYLLVEDATGKNRTIMVKEYLYNSLTSEWPVLYQSFLKPHGTSVSAEKVRERAWQLYVEREEYDGEQPPVDSIKRSTSLRTLPDVHLPTPQPYENASGNSVVLTSNIASTSAATGTPNIPGGKAIQQMSKRVQVLKGNAMLAAKSSNDEFFRNGLSRRASTGGVKPGLGQKTFVSQDQLIRMLRMAREPCTEVVSFEERVKNREKVEMGLKGRDQDTASGYCENCRLRYNDLSVHVLSKKHRRFAENDANFEEVDALLETLERPYRQFNQVLYPPCQTKHRQDDECLTCHPTFDMDGTESPDSTRTRSSDSGVECEDDVYEENEDGIGLDEEMV